MRIQKVENSRDIKEFINLPFRIYKDDSNWVPPLKQDVEKVFDNQKNKLFASGEACRWNLISAEGEIIGRIAAFVNQKYSKGMNQRTGGLGFFECINNPEAARSLLKTACDWLEERKMQAIDGPINFGEKNMFWGLQTDNFEDPPSYGMNYNPKYYVKFFEDYGFQVFYHQLCYKRDLHVPPQEIFVRKSESLLQNKGFYVSNVRGKSLDQISQDFVTVYNAAWGGHLGFKKMSLAQGKKTIKALKPIMDRDIVIFAYDHERPIGFYVNIPELNDIFKYVNGNLNWLGKIKFLFHKWRKTPSTMVGVVFGVDREYHGKGVEGALIKWAGDNVVPMNRYHETVMTWVGDFNPKMLKVISNLGAWEYRRLSTYRLMLDSTIPFERALIIS